jgi:hypothetical protein
MPIYGTTSRDIAYIFPKSSLNLYLFCGHLIFAFNFAELAQKGITLILSYKNVSYVIFLILLKANGVLNLNSYWF